MADFRLFLPDDRGIIGSVDEQGVLTFVVLAGEGAPIRGTEMFDLMMRAFGEKVRAIHGVWRRGFEGSPSVNLDKVNELTGTGVPLDEAVRHAWTVTRARRWGYTRVRVTGEREGSPGNYSKIDVLMDKELPGVSP